MKKALITGSSGYVGNYTLKYMAQQCPDWFIYGMSRTGKMRDEEVKKLSNVQFMKGNCLLPETFEHKLNNIEAVIHAVGILFENKKDASRTYSAVNRDTCIDMAKELNRVSGERNEKRRFVMISSEKGLPFMPGYLESKREAEDYLLNECPNLDVHILRPGFIWNSRERVWSMPVKYIVDAAWAADHYLLKYIPPLSNMADPLIPARSVELETVAHVAIQCAIGRFKERIYTNQMLLDEE